MDADFSDGWELNRIASIAKSVSGDRVSGTDRTSDVTAFDCIDLSLSIFLGGMDLPQLSDVFFFIPIRIQNARVGF